MFVLKYAFKNIFCLFFISEKRDARNLKKKDMIL